MTATILSSEWEIVIAGYVTEGEGWAEVRSYRACLVHDPSWPDDDFATFFVPVVDMPDEPPDGFVEVVRSFYDVRNGRMYRDESEFMARTSDDVNDLRWKADQALLKWREA